MLLVLLRECLFGLIDIPNRFSWCVDSYESIKTVKMMDGSSSRAVELLLDPMFSKPYTATLPGYGSS